MVTALPRPQVIVGALLRNLPSFGWIALLLFTLPYAYSVMGVFLFGAKDPRRFGSLWNSLRTMFGVLTLEGRVDIMRDQLDGLPRDDGTRSPGSPLAATDYFVSFILAGTMIFLNLLVGVIVNSLSEMPEAGRPGEAEPSPPSPLPSLHAPGLEPPHATLLVERLARIEGMLEELGRGRPRGVNTRRPSVIVDAGATRREPTFQAESTGRFRRRLRPGGCHRPSS